jgi:hypothetical protein
MRLGRIGLWQWRLRPQRTLLAVMLEDEEGLARLRAALERMPDEGATFGDDTPREDWTGMQAVLAHWTLDAEGFVGEDDLAARRRLGHVGDVLRGVDSHLVDGRPMPLLRVRFSDGYTLWAWKCDLVIPGEQRLPPRFDDAEDEADAGGPKAS